MIVTPTGGAHVTKIISSHQKTEHPRDVIILICCFQPNHPEPSQVVFLPQPHQTWTAEVSDQETLLVTVCGGSHVRLTYSVHPFSATYRGLGCCGNRIRKLVQMFFLLSPVLQLLLWDPEVRPDVSCPEWLPITSSGSFQHKQAVFPWWAASEHFSFSLRGVQMLRQTNSIYRCAIGLIPIQVLKSGTRQLSSPELFWMVLLLEPRQQRPR